ncbi:MAG: hypothetical protein WAT66_04835 [Actinomycetota bacterium]
MSIRSLRGAPIARMALGVAAVAIVVAANQTSVKGRSTSVLGLKVERCSVTDESGTTRVDTGSRLVVAQPLSVRITKGAPGASLAPPIKITPAVAQPIPPVTVSLGLRGAGARRVTVTMSVRNLSDCPVAVSVGRITAEVGTSPATVVAVRFGGRDRVILQSGSLATGRAVLPVERDGSWRVAGSAYADVGSAS